MPSTPSDALYPLPPNKDARYDFETMLALARRLLKDSTPAAIGISFGGSVDAARGRVILSHHVPGWEDTPLRDQLQAALGAPVSVDNDANVAALGEYEFGAGRVVGAGLPRPYTPRPGGMTPSLLYVTVSTGVGGGWILAGRIFHGADGTAGEIGHTVVDPHGPLCVCGRTLSPLLSYRSSAHPEGESVRRRGCVEVMACGPAIAREARARLLVEPGAGAKLRARVGSDLSAITGECVAHAADEGDELVQQVMDDAARALGFGIGTAITLMNPARVVIGGGVSKSGERWWSVVRAAARANTLPQMRVEIVPAALGDDAPLWAAVALAESVARGEPVLSTFASLSVNSVEG